MWIANFCTLIGGSCYNCRTYFSKKCYKKFIRQIESKLGEEMEGTIKVGGSKSTHALKWLTSLNVHILIYVAFS